MARSDESNNIYPAKLLLFGEYTVLTGSSALAVPIGKFHARWVSTGRDSDLDRRFVELVSPLMSIPLSCEKDEERWQKDRQQGMVLQSSIPFGKGLGSSGSLCAALYHRYYQQDRRASEEQVKQDLVALENYFHGKSSGMDPLCIFWDLPVLQDEKGIRRRESPLNWGQWQVFLLDSEQARSTRQLVNTYREKLKDPAFVSGIEKISHSTEACIKWLLKGEPLVFGKYMRRLSEHQLQHWDFLIPEHMADFWRKGLSSDDYYMKLCGAGGGGYFLGFAREGMELPEGSESVLED